MLAAPAILFAVLSHCFGPLPTIYLLSFGPINRLYGSELLGTDGTHAIEAFYAPLGQLAERFPELQTWLGWYAAIWYLW